MTPFDYPADETGRRHAPSGYLDAESFRPWIRDEFTFRCLYCLRHERWEPDLGVFEIDHFIPIGRSPELRLKYANLVYSCRTCNAAKGVRSFTEVRTQTEFASEEGAPVPSGPEKSPGNPAGSLE